MTSAPTAIQGSIARFDDRSIDASRFDRTDRSRCERSISISTSVERAVRRDRVVGRVRSVAEKTRASNRSMEDARSTPRARHRETRDRSDRSSRRRRVVVVARRVVVASRRRGVELERIAFKNQYNQSPTGGSRVRSKTRARAPRPTWIPWMTTVTPRARRAGASEDETRTSKPSACATDDWPSETRGGTSASASARKRTTRRRRRRRRRR